jgi:hypothetical protein
MNFQDKRSATVSISKPQIEVNVPVSCQSRVVALDVQLELVCTDKQQSQLVLPAAFPS